MYIIVYKNYVIITTYKICMNIGFTIARLYVYKICGLMLWIYANKNTMFVCQSMRIDFYHNDFVMNK